MGQISFAWLQAVLRNMSAGVVSTDAERRILWANDAFSRLTGYAPDEVVGRRPVEVLLDPAADPAVGQSLVAHLGEGLPFEAEVPLGRKDGRLRWLHMATQSIAGVGGWALDVPSGHLNWSAETDRLHETTPVEYQPSVATAITFYAPASVPLMEAAATRAIRTGSAWSCTTGSARNRPGSRSRSNRWCTRPRPGLMRCAR